MFNPGLKIGQIIKNADIVEIFNGNQSTNNRVANCRELLNQGSFPMLSGKNVRSVNEERIVCYSEIYLLTKVTS